MYRIEFDERTRIMRIGADGFWSLGTLAAFSTMLLAHAVATKLRHGDFATLIDLRGYPVQSPEVAKGVELLLRKAMQITTAPVATATGSHLLRMQAERVLHADHSRVFLDIDDAIAWLETEWVQARALAA